MGTTTTARITVNSNGERRSLLSLSSRAGKPLIIGMRPANYYKDAGTLIPDQPITGKEILSQKYTIHLTKNSEKELNCVHHTLKLATGEDINTYFYTQAIKKYGRFAPIFTKRFGDLSGENYNSAISARKDIEIGKIDNNSFSLILTLCIGPNRNNFDLEQQYDVNFHQFFGEEFSLVLIWSFLSLPPNNSGCISHMENLPFHLWENTEEEKLWTPHIIGMENSECIDFHRFMRSEMEKEFIASLRATYADELDQEFESFFQIAGHFKNAQKNTPEWRNHVMLLYQKGIIGSPKK